MNTSLAIKGNTKKNPILMEKIMSESQNPEAQKTKILTENLNLFLRKLSGFV